MPTGTITAYGALPLGHGPGTGGAGTNVGINAEDVLDLIVDLSPWENPVVTLMPKVQATSTRHEWITDRLQTSRPRHGITEGNDFGADGTTLQTKARRSNFLQHFRYEVKVSNLQRLMNPYGISDMYAYEVGKLTKQIGKDIESRLLEDTILNTGATATFQGIEQLANGARMKTLGELVAEADTNAIANGSKFNIRDAETMTATTFASGIWNGTVPSAAAVDQVPISEAIVTKALELTHGGGAGTGDGGADTGGGHPDTLIVGPASFGHIGAWGGVGTTPYPFPSALPPLTNARLARVVRFYDSNFGLIEVVNSRHCPQASNTGVLQTFARGTSPNTMSPDATGRNNGMAYLIERNRFRLAFARGVQHMPIPANGDAARGMVVSDVTCELLGSGSAFILYGVNNVGTP